jgi:hypothetical protein
VAIDEVFKGTADPTRRELLTGIYERVHGQTLKRAGEPPAHSSRF